jgi:polysaccharide biosynthesis protein PslE
MDSSHSTGTSVIDGRRLVDTARVLARHWRLSAAFFAASISITLLAVWLLPPTYRSESKLFIRLGRESASLDPTAMIGRPSPSGSPVVSGRENEINSITEILQSRVLLEQVVDAVGPQIILLGSDPADTDPSLDQRLSEPVASGVPHSRKTANIAIETDWRRTPSDRDRAIITLQEMIEVQAIKKSDVVRVACNTHSPRLAQKVVAHLIDFYLDEHLRLNRTSGAENFLDRQTAEMRAKLVGAEEDLRKLKDKTGLASPDVQRELMVARAGRLEDELLATAAALGSAEAETRQLRDQVATLPKMTTTAHMSGIPNHSPEMMRIELFRLQMLEQELASKYTDKHFAVRQIRERVPAAKEVLAATDESHEQTTSGPNTVYEQSHVALVKQEPLLSSLRAKSDALQSQLAQVRDQIKALNADELKIAQLTRDVKWHETNYQAYAQHLEQNRIDQALEAGRISSINIIQPATFEPKPVGPKVLVILGLGLVIGLIGAIGLPLVADGLDLPLANPQEVENHLGVGVLGSVPRFQAEQLSGNGKT